MSVRRGTALTLSFAAVDSELRPKRRTGVGWSSGDVLVSKDGGAFSSAVNLPVEIGLSGRYSLMLTAPEMDAAWVHVVVEKSGIDPLDIVLGTDGSPTGTVQADPVNSASQFKTDRAEAITDHWKDCLLLFTSGALTGQVKKVSSYDGATKIAAVSSPFTGTPNVGDRFVLINL
jgi:hypothetical protein